MPTILLIDDDTDLRKMLAKVLERERYRVLEAGTGVEAMRVLQIQTPDLVVTDLIMPDQDGIGTINQLKKDHPDIKIIAISGGGRMISQDYLNIARMLGAHHTFKKPFDNREFVAKIRELLSA